MPHPPEEPSVTDTAALANDVESTLGNALESIAADPSLVAAAQ